MNMIELHIIQSFPVTCLNRDDLGAPKSALFGGVQRARVSSQCWKRAIRSLAAENKPQLFAGKRGHFVAELIEKAMIIKELTEDVAKKAGKEIAAFVGKTNTKYKNGHKTEVALYFSPGEIEAIAEQAVSDYNENGKIEPKKGALKKIITSSKIKDLADIALFGRMVASDHSLMLEGAANFSHAISTHKVSNEIDFFSAVDDLKPGEAEGAGHIGTLEFNSACYYRYIGINLDLLTDKDHLRHFTKEELDTVLDTFLRSCLEANPTARKNSQFGYTRPDYVLGLRRIGQPLSLANAFEIPINVDGKGYVEKSKDNLKKHFVNMKETWSIKTDVETEIPKAKIGEFIKRLLDGGPVNA